VVETGPKYKFEMRLFDGRMNETRAQALEDFERVNGFKPVTDEHQETFSPSQIRLSLKGGNEKVFENASKIVKEEIHRLSGLLPMVALHSPHHQTFTSQRLPSNDSDEKPTSAASENGGLAKAEVYSNIGSSYAELREVLIKSKLN
jgi:hypothetical protein